MRATTQCAEDAGRRSATSAPGCHSSHHVKAIEVYRGKAILYGCGDLLNDYEGIAGYESYRGDLALLYFPTLDATSGDLVRLTMTPTQTRHFRINRAGATATAWLARTLGREGAQFRTKVQPGSNGTLELKWPRAGRRSQRTI